MADGKFKVESLAIDNKIMMPHAMYIYGSSFSFFPIFSEWRDLQIFIVEFIDPF